ncbi:MAG: hypothetical protein WBG92_03085 [Thiohalocapsa sp.]
MTSIIYDVPLVQLAAFRDRPLIVRSEQPGALVAQLRADDLDKLAYIQLRGLPKNIDVLVHWANDLPIDLLLHDPARDFASLYNYAKLLDNHPVRVSLPVEDGFEKAVKLASSLQFAVRLQVGQPKASLIESLARQLDDYLYKSTVSQPIEYFHSVLLSFCNHEPINLWATLEQDPAFFRSVDEQGQEHSPVKSAETRVDLNPDNFVADWGKRLLAEGAECADCRFFDVCRGYFKWPRRDYDCAGVRTLFTTLKRAGEELSGDLAAMPPAGGAIA